MTAMVNGHDDDDDDVAKAIWWLASCSRTRRPTVCHIELYGSCAFRDNLQKTEDDRNFP